MIYSDDTSGYIFKLKLRILCEGLNFDKNSLAKLRQTFNYKSDPGIYNVSQVSDPGIDLPQEIILRDVHSTAYTVVAAAHYPESTMLVTYLANGNLGIIDTSNQTILPVLVELPETPAFWNNETIPGYRDIRILSTCGLYQANLWLFHECALPDKNQECRFCGVKCIENAKNKNNLFSLHNAIHHPQDESQKMFLLAPSIAKILRKAIAEYYFDHCHLVFISGNLPVGMEDYIWEYILIPLLKTLRKEFDLQKLEAMAILTPPRNLQLLNFAYDAGLPAVSFNMEFFSNKYFKSLCPAKYEYGYENYIKALKHAVKVFGKNKVFTNLIVGIEPIAETLKGILYLAEQNIVANPVIFHRDWGAKMWNVKIKNPSEIWMLFKKTAEVFAARNFIPPYCLSCARTSLIHEAVNNLLIGDYNVD